MSYTIVGDTNQPPLPLASAGDLPSVSVAFNPVKVRLRAPDGKTLVEDAFNIPLLNFLPRLVNGDNEFNGHGPNIYIETEVIAGTETTLVPKILATFIETQADFTEFSESSKGQGIDISSQPSVENKIYPGYVIDTILGDAKDVLNTADLDLHSEQSISIGEDELVSTYKIMGDSNGDDHPYVALSFNPIRVQLRKPS